MSASAPPAVISDLRERIACLEGGNARARTVLPFGVAAIDRVLPGGGLALGGLHEVAGGGNGAIDGAAAALFAAGIAARTRGKVLWCVTRPDLFAPAIAQAGLPPDRVIYVEAGDEKSILACFEEGLRHPRAGCRRCRGGSPVHDGFAPAPTGGRDVRRDRHRHPSLAPADRGSRFRTADGVRHPMACLGASLDSPARARRWTRPMAARADPMPWGRKRRFRSGGQR